MPVRQQSKMTFYYTYTGFGDIVLDLIGTTTWIAFDPSLHIFFVLNNNRKPANRVYDMSLFKYEDKKLNLMDSHMGGLKPNSGVKTLRGAPGCSIHPWNLSKLTGVPVVRVCDEFKKNAHRLKACGLIVNAMPQDLQDTIGIHLRKSDKIGERDPHHGTTLEEFHDIVYMMKEYVSEEILAGNKSFFICSEDQVWRREFENWIEETGGQILHTHESDALRGKRGWGPILDFFCLSKCKKIIQGIGYSTFSMAASLIGGGVPLVNLHMKAVEKPEFYLNWWAPLLNLQMADEEDTVPFREMRDGADRGVAAIRTE